VINIYYPLLNRIPLYKHRFRNRISLYKHQLTNRIPLYKHQLTIVLMAFSVIRVCKSSFLNLIFGRDKKQFLRLMCHLIVLHTPGVVT